MQRSAVRARRHRPGAPSPVLSRRHRFEVPAAVAADRLPDLGLRSLGCRGRPLIGRVVAGRGTRSPVTLDVVVTAWSDDECLVVVRTVGPVPENVRAGTLELLEVTMDAIANRLARPGVVVTGPAASRSLRWAA